VANIKESLENIENIENIENPRGLENPESIAANFSYCFIFIMYNIILHYIMSFILDNKKIDLNIMTDNSIISSTTEMNFTKLAKPEILAKCKELGFTNYKSKNKKALIELINSKKDIIDTIDILDIGSTDDYNDFISEQKNLLFYIDKLLKTHSLQFLAKELNLAPGTITRWIELGDIPKNYEFDILKLSNIKINYSNYSTKEKDQFFTPYETAQHCFQIFIETINNYGEDYTNFKYIEPSAGDGSFLKVLPNDTISMDIEPRHPSVINYDYLDWKPSDNNKYVVFGNPPFGLRGHMALKFINHSYKFADYVCFILPQLFESDGKGVPRKRVIGYNLIHSVKIQSNFYEPDGNIIKINTIFQIWSKHHKNEMYDIKDYTNENMKIYSMSDGGTVSSTRNKAMIGKCDIYIPSTCFGKENMKCYSNFEDLPGKKGYGIVFNTDKQNMITKALDIEWHNIAFLSTNSAYNLRSSQIYSLFEF